MPALIGFLSIVFLSLAAAAAVLTLGLHSRTLSALAGVLMAAFPCLGYTFLYMFTASAYCLAILLAVLSVWLAQKGGWPRSLAACLLLALSMGIYQAYAAVAVSLSVLAVLRACLDHRAGWKDTLRLGLRLMGVLAAGAALYYGLLQLFLSVKGLELLSYLGMSQAGGGYPVAQLPRLILSAYKQVLVFFFLPGSSSPFTTPVLVLLDLLALALGALFCFTALTRRSLWKQPWRPVGGLVMVALLPLAAGFAQVIAPFSDATPIMKYAYVSIYLTVVLAADLGLSLLPPPPVGPRPAPGRWRAVWSVCASMGPTSTTCSTPPPPRPTGPPSATPPACSPALRAAPATPVRRRLSSSAPSPPTGSTPLLRVTPWWTITASPWTPWPR